MNELFISMKEHVRKTLVEPGSHGFDHTLRVTRLCEIIGKNENADLNILIPAALFHDIARPLEKKTGISHEIEGSRIAEEYLQNIGYPRDLIPFIIHAIRTHRFSSDLVPETLEAKILSDADKLDAIGAVGIARTFISAGERQGDIIDAMDHIDEKLIKLKYMMYTRTGEEIAIRRHEYLLAFVRTIRKEMEE